MNSTDKYDVAIIGGGLAGLALAIQCASQNISVALFEKENYPFHKVCGEYISMESKPFLESLGFSFSGLHLPVINRLSLSGIKGNEYRFALPLGGFGISRYLLDESLYKITVSKGAHVYTGTKVNDIGFQNDEFKIMSAAGDFRAKTAVAGWGKRSNIDIKWKRNFAQQKTNKLNNYIGIKYHISYQHPADEIALHNFYNGYCGMSKIEDDKSCLCYLTTAENLRQCNNSIAEMERNVLFKNPQLKRIFSEAKFLYKEPVTISQISFDKKQQVENHVLMTGDTAGMITPLCGNGMSMAFHSSKIALAAIQKFLQGQNSRQQMEDEYCKNWSKNFSARLKVGRIVQGLFGGNNTTSLFLKTMNALPFVANRIIKATHGEPF